MDFFSKYIDLNNLKYLLVWFLENKMRKCHIPIFGLLDASGDRDVKRLNNIEIFYVLFILAFWTMLNFYGLWSSLSKFFPQLCAFRLYTYLTQVTAKKVSWFAFITH